MKKVFGLVLLLAGFSTSVIAEEGKSGLTLNGYLQIENRVRILDSVKSWDETRLALTGEAKPNDSSRVFAELWVKTKLPVVSTLSDISNPGIINPYNLSLREAYADVYGFIFKGLDLRVGRQRIAWGTADNIGPTDSINPKDLEDLWDFGRKIGSDAITLNYYLYDFKLTGVYATNFVPAVLPASGLANYFYSGFAVPAGLVLTGYTTALSLPANDLKENYVAALKLARTLFGIDFSLSYVDGRDGLPVLRRAYVTPVNLMAGMVVVSTELEYPKTHITGFDFSGSLFDIGYWGELAVFSPDKVVTTIDLSALSMLGLSNQEVVAIDDKPYTKYVLGCDYTFPGNVYINLQYLHGFFHERGEDNLEDYVMFNLDWKLFDEKLKLVPLAGAIELKDTADLSNNYAVVYTPEIVYIPVDGMELCLGSRIIYGMDTTLFGKMKDNDEAYLRIKYSF
ncbi:MAG: DUF1302 family protein [Elusimicrobiota bacterium]